MNKTLKIVLIVVGVIAILWFLISSIISFVAFNFVKDFANDVIENSNNIIENATDIIENTNDIINDNTNITEEVEDVINNGTVNEMLNQAEDIIENNITTKDNVQDLQNKLLYQQAEFANYKRRREEETASLLKYKNLDLGLELLTIVDSLERALNVNEESLSDDVKKYLNGFKIMYNNLVNIMRKNEITEIDCLNKEFDHNTSQALMTEHVEGIEPGVVIEVLQKGYMLKDKLLRAALVKVSE